LTYDLGSNTLEEALACLIPKLREAQAARKSYLDRCARCFLKGLCSQCPAKSWVENGTLDTPVEYLCDVAHAQARDLGLLAGDEHGWEVESWRERIENMTRETTNDS
jgi:hypothetical protein